MAASGHLIPAPPATEGGERRGVAGATGRAGARGGEGGSGRGRGRGASALRWRAGGRHPAAGLGRPAGHGVAGGCVGDPGGPNPFSLGACLALPLPRRSAPRPLPRAGRSPRGEAARSGAATGGKQRRPRFPGLRSAFPPCPPRHRPGWALTRECWAPAAPPCAGHRPALPSRCA